MSKVFDAILKLERETGRLLPGMLTEGPRILENGSPRLSPVEEQSSDNVVESGETLLEEDPAGVDGFAVGRIPAETVEIKPETRIVYHQEPDSAGADRFRLLRMRLWPLWESGKLKTLLVTSAHAQDGKSTVVLNIASALAEQGKRKVLVVEGDLVHPSLSVRLGLGERPGLAECLEAGAEPLSCIRRLEPLNWFLLPAGRCLGNSTELLQSPQVADIFETLQPHFDWIVIDTPPVVPLTDTLSLRQYADAALLVVRAGQTPGAAVDAAVDRYGSKNLLGIILNGSDQLENLYSDYRQYYGRPKNKSSRS